MRAKKDGSSPSAPSPVPAHVFAPEYLALLAQRDEPETAPEADTAGTWHVEAHPRGWAVLRNGESLEKGHTPTAVVLRKEVALVLAAVLPGTGRRFRYRLSLDADSEGLTPLLLEGRQVGTFLYFDEELLAGLNAVDALMASPSDFAWLLDAMGGLALEHVDRIATGHLEALTP
jgi:hypothetical protein